jgi:hypothetical protein
MTTHISSVHSNEQFARRVASQLNDAANQLPHDISERLKAARSLALSKRKVVKTVTASNVSVTGNALTLQGGGDWGGLWKWLGSALPLVALVAGLMTIALVQDDLRALEVAEVDAELLTDDLPPAAYTDPGFTQYLRGELNR